MTRISLGANLFEEPPAPMAEELVQVMLQAPDMRIERIVSRGHRSPDDFWYDQETNEFVALLKGSAAIRFDGQVSVYDLTRDDSPCYHCLFPEGGDVEEVRCAVMGVFAPLTGIIGTTQAAEALKLVAGIGESLTGRLLLLDSLDMEWRTVRFKKDAGCTVCGPNGDGRSGEYLRRSGADRESATGACPPASPVRAD